MTADFLFRLLLGHLVGDYLLQNEWMALNKSRKDTELPGFVHALVYTLAVAVLTYQSTDTWRYREVWCYVIFFSHWPVDRYSLAEKWLKAIRGRTLEGFLHRGHRDIPYDYYPHLTEGPQNYRILRGGFHALVYAVTDNTMHLLLLYLGWTFLQKAV